MLKYRKHSSMLSFFQFLRGKQISVERYRHRHCDQYIQICTQRQESVLHLLKSTEINKRPCHYLSFGIPGNTLWLTLDPAGKTAHAPKSTFRCVAVTELHTTTSVNWIARAYHAHMHAYTMTNLLGCILSLVILKNSE